MGAVRSQKLLSKLSKNASACIPDQIHEFQFFHLDRKIIQRVEQFLGKSLASGFIEGQMSTFQQHNRGSQACKILSCQSHLLQCVDLPALGNKSWVLEL